MNRIEMNVNNNRIMSLTQHRRDESITLTTYGAGTGEIDHEETISAGDMVTMLNWYRLQKRNGNTSLYFD